MQKFEFFKICNVIFHILDNTSMFDSTLSYFRITLIKIWESSSTYVGFLPLEIELSKLVYVRTNWSHNSRNKSLCRLERKHIIWQDSLNNVLNYIPGEAPTLASLFLATNTMYIMHTSISISSNKYNVHYAHQHLLTHIIITHEPHQHPVAREPFALSLRASRCLCPPPASATPLMSPHCAHTRKPPSARAYASSRPSSA